MWWQTGQAWWPPEERPEARLGCFNCPGRAAVAGLKGPLFPGSDGRALMEAQGVYLSLFAKRSLKGGWHWALVFQDQT